MAETTFTLDQLKQIVEITKDADLSNYIEGMSKAGEKVALVSDLTKKLGETQTAVISKMAEGTTTFGSWLDKIEKLDMKSIQFFQTVEDNVTKYLNNQDLMSHGWGVLGTEVALVGAKMFDIIPSAITGMGSLGTAGYDAGSQISKAFKDVEPLLSKAVTKPIAEMMTNFSEAATSAYGLQREILHLAAAQGNFNTVINESNGSFKNMDQEYMNMVNMTYTAASATGQTVSSVMDLSKTIGSIPGALNENVQVGTAGISQLVATSQLATGFIRNQAEVGKLLSDMYTNLGTSGTGAYEAIAKIYDKAGDSKLRFESFTTTVTDIAKSFKMLGDNTNAATNVVEAFDKAFKNSNISPAAMQEVITGMTAGVQKLDLAKMSFVSGQTGGPGGLAGAYQMEYAMQTGHMDEVLSKTMQAMQQQFGGQIITLKEAAQNPDMSGEFYKQVQYLTQIAGVASTDREAYRILEAMQSGALGNLSQTMGTQGDAKTLETAVTRGGEEQSRTTSAVMRLHQWLEKEQLITNDIIKDTLPAIEQALKIGHTIDSKTAMTNAAGRSGTTGVLPTEKSTDFVSQSREDILQKQNENFMNFINKGNETIKNSINQVFGKNNDNSLDVLKESVGARLPPGTGAGIAPIGGIQPELAPINKNAGNITNEITPVNAWNEGTFPPIQMDVRADPLKIDIVLKDFDQKVSNAANLVYTKRRGQEIQQAVTGDGTGG
jgi:hypothetical protein